MQLILVLLCLFIVTFSEEDDSMYEKFKPMLKQVGLESLFPKIVEQIKQNEQNIDVNHSSITDQIIHVKDKITELLSLAKNNKKYLSTQVEALVKMIINKVKPEFKVLNYDGLLLQKIFNLTRSEVVRYREIYSAAKSNLKELELYLYKDTPLC